MELLRVESRIKKRKSKKKREFQNVEERVEFNFQLSHNGNNKKINNKQLTMKINITNINNDFLQTMKVLDF